MERAIAAVATPATPASAARPAAVLDRGGDTARRAVLSDRGRRRAARVGPLRAARTAYEGRDAAPNADASIPRWSTSTISGCSTRDSSRRSTTPIRRPSRFSNRTTTTIPSRRQSTLWHDPAQQPGLLEWRSSPIVRLAWCRVHNGEFKQPRRSYAGVQVMPGGATPDLTFLGRVADSLMFQVSNGVVPTGLQRNRRPWLPLRPRHGHGGRPAARRGPDAGGEHIPRRPSRVSRTSPTSIRARRSSRRRSTVPRSPLRAPCGRGAGSNRRSSGTRSCSTRSSGTTRGSIAHRAREFPRAAANRPALSCSCRTTPRLPLVTRPSPRRPRACPRTSARGQPSVVVRDSACCDSTDVSDAVALNRSILLHYLETMLQWGDALMRCHSPEAFQQARVIYDTMAMILGPHSARGDRHAAGDAADGVELHAALRAAQPAAARALHAHAGTARADPSLPECVPAAQRPSQRRHAVLGSARLLRLRDTGVLYGWVPLAVPRRMLPPARVRIVSCSCCRRRRSSPARSASSAPRCWPRSKRETPNTWRRCAPATSASC